MNDAPRDRRLRSIASSRSRSRLLAVVFLLTLCSAAAGLAAGPAAAVVNNQQYGFLGQIGGPGTGVGQFGNGASPGPYGVAVDAAGNVFVVDPSNAGDRIHKFAPDGTHLCSFGTPGSAAGQLGNAYGIAVAPNGTVFVIDTWRADANRIQYFTSPDGGSTYVTAGQIPIVGSAGNFYNIAADGAGCVYISDNLLHRVLRYRVSDGALVATIGTMGSGPDLTDWPKGLAVTPDGLDLCIADTSYVKRFHSADGGISYSFAQAFGDAPGTFTNPRGVALDSSANVYVTDVSLNKVVKFDSSGAVVTSWGTAGAGNEEYRGANSVAVSPTGCVYVADTGWPDPGGHPEYDAQNHRVMRYARDLTPPTSIVTGLPSGWTNAAQVSLTFSGTDPVVANQFTSGYDATQLFSGGVWITYGGPFIVSAEGATTVQYRAADMRNNYEAGQQLQVRIDRTKPVTAVGGIPEAWSKTPVPVSLSASDALSGVARTEYSTNGGATWTSGAAATIALNGVTTLLYRAVDHAGNVEDGHSATVQVDTVKPAPKPLADVTVKHGKTAKLRYRVTDGPCPQATVVIKISKGGKTRKTLSVGVAGTGRDLTYSWKCTLPKGRYTWTVSATDLAGNAQARTVTKRLIVK